jgi:O-antigen/teichoic acid export membrane protein
MLILVKSYGTQFFIAVNRFHLLVRGIGVGYISMAFGIAYSFLSIPLALGYLGKTEYGLWALVLSVTSYLNFSELGMTNSVQRHLIDLKAVRPHKEYGAIFLTGAVVFGVIGCLCLLVGGGAVLLVTPMFKIPEAYLVTFEWLLFGSVLLFVLSIGTRILGVPLYVYQRHDLSELSNIFLYVIWIAVLWIGLRMGLGVYSLLLSQGVGFLWTCGFNIIACNRLGLYPSRAEWSCPSKVIVWEIAVFARDSFLQSLGQQLVNTLPMLLISRWMGLDAAAVWSVANKSYFILRQILGRPFQYGVSMIADILSNKGERAMLARWMQMSQLMTAAALALYPICTAMNREFLSIWTHGTIGWSRWDDISCGIYYFLLVSLFPWYGIVGINKKFGITRYTSLIEGVLLALLCWLLHARLGMTGFLLSLIISKIVMGLLPSLYYLHDAFGNDIWKVFQGSLIRPLVAAPLCIVSALGVVYLAPAAHGWAMFLFSLAAGSVVSVGCVIFLGISREVRDEFLAKCSGIVNRA